MPQGSTPRYPIQISLSSPTQQQQGSQQSQSAPVTVDLNFAYPNSSSTAPLEARTSYYSPFDLNLDDLTSATSDSDSDSDSDPDDNDAFTAPKTDSDSTPSTNTTTTTNTSSSSGPCTLLLNLTSPAAHVSGAATVNIYALDGSSSSSSSGGGGGGGGGSPGTLVGTARFEKGAAAVVNSFACPAEGEEMGFRLEVAGGADAGASSTSSASAGASSLTAVGGDGGGDGSGEDGGDGGGDGGGSGSGSVSGNGGASSQGQGQGESVSFLQGDEEGTGLEMRWGC